MSDEQRRTGRDDDSQDVGGLGEELGSDDSPAAPQSGRGSGEPTTAGQPGRQVLDEERLQDAQGLPRLDAVDPADRASGLAGPATSLGDTAGAGTVQGTAGSADDSSADVGARPALADEDDALREGALGTDLPPDEAPAEGTSQPG